MSDVEQVGVSYPEQGAEGAVCRGVQVDPDPDGRVGDVAAGEPLLELLNERLGWRQAGMHLAAGSDRFVEQLEVVA